LQQEREKRIDTTAYFHKNLMVPLRSQQLANRILGFFHHHRDAFRAAFAASPEADVIAQVTPAGFGFSRCQALMSSGVKKPDAQRSAARTQSPLRLPPAERLRVMNHFRASPSVSAVLGASTLTGADLLTAWDSFVVSRNINPGDDATSAHYSLSDAEIDD
jgi:hypothetical protein